MVVSLAKDKNLSTTDADIAQIIQRTKEGDLGIVLSEYENEIRNPFRSLVLGDLIRLLLIQVQKSKVDLELSMNALDQLLKANELNFAFLAVIPTLGVVVVSWMSFSRFLKRRSWVWRERGMEVVRGSLRLVIILLLCSHIRNP